MIIGKKYIGNQLSAKGLRTYKMVNPQLNVENETIYTEANSEEVNVAAMLASSAFKNYSKMPEMHSIKHWVRPFSYQSWPNDLLLDELKNENPLHIIRSVNEVQTQDKI